MQKMRNVKCKNAKPFCSAASCERGKIMAKRKSLEIISTDVAQLIANAKNGLLKGKSIQFNCGDGLTVIVNKGSGNAAWYARVSGKTILLGDYAEMDYQTASNMVSDLQGKKDEEKKAVSNCPTVSEYFEPFVKKWKKTHTLSETSYNNYKTLMSTTLYPFQDIKLTDLSRLFIVQTVKELDQTVNNKHRAVALLCNMLSVASEEKLISVNPIADLLHSKFSPFPLQKSKPRATLPPEEFIEKVVKPLTKAKAVYRPVFLMCFLTGFRFSEFSNLRWSLIDLENKTMKLPAINFMSNHDDKYFVKPITPPMMDLLQYMHHVNTIHSDYVFQSPSRSKPAPMSDNAIREPWRELVNSEVCDFDGIKLTIRSWFKKQVEIDPKFGFARLVFPTDLVDELFTRNPKQAVDRDYVADISIEPARSALNAWNQWLLKNLPEEFMEILKVGHSMKL